jgi:hypothetical protein
MKYPFRKFKAFIWSEKRNQPVCRDMMPRIIFSACLIPNAALRRWPSVKKQESALLLHKFVH